MTTSSSGPVVYQHLQTSLLAIPQTLLCYWLRERAFELQAGRRVALGAGGQAAALRLDAGASARERALDGAGAGTSSRAAKLEAKRAVALARIGGAEMAGR